MLTGTLPFAGGNAAELTLQHLNDEPDLSSLSATDRYAVSRALSKDPQHRYATCREFVDALFKATPVSQIELQRTGRDAILNIESAGFSAATDTTKRANRFVRGRRSRPTGTDPPTQLLVELPPVRLRG